MATNTQLTKHQQELEEAAAVVRERLGTADVAIVLGSFLGDFVDVMENKQEISYSEIPNMPQVTVVGHSGKIVSGYISGKKFFCFSGRVHFYEGISFHEVCFAARMCAILGVKIFFLTNASGGAMPGMYPGCFMVIRDHVALTRANPLLDFYRDGTINTHDVDWSLCWSKRLSDQAVAGAKKLGVKLFEGTYGWTPGPAYETPMEVEMAHFKLNVGAFGMSTVPEALAATACGMEVLGLSMITNVAAGMSEVETTSEEVQETAKLASGRFKLVLKAVADEITLRDENGRHIVAPRRTNENVEIKHRKFRGDFAAVNEACQALSHMSVPDLALLLNTTHDYVLQTLSNISEVSFADIPHFPGTFGRYVVGKNKSGKIVAAFVTNEITGFDLYESTFIAQILQCFGVKFVLQILAGGLVDGDKSQSKIVAVKDVINFTRINPYQEIHSVCKRARGHLFPEHVIMHSALDIVKSTVNEVQASDEDDSVLIAFEGLSSPNTGMLYLAKQARAGLWGTQNVTPLFTSRYMRLSVGAVAVLSDSEQTRSNLQQLVHIVADKVASLTVHRDVEYLASRLPAIEPQSINYKSIKASAEYLQQQLQVPKAAILDYDLNIDMKLQINKKVSLTSFFQGRDNGESTDAEDLQIMEAKLPSGVSVLALSADISVLSIHQRLFLIRALGMAGVKAIVHISTLTSTSDSLAPGTPCCVTDHINFSGFSPLAGPNENLWGVRFPDMTMAYNQPLIKHLIQSIPDVKPVKSYWLPSMGYYSTNELLVFSSHTQVASHNFVAEVTLARHMNITSIVLGVVNCNILGETKTMGPDEISEKLLPAIELSVSDVNTNNTIN